MHLATEAPAPSPSPPPRSLLRSTLKICTKTPLLPALLGSPALVLLGTGTATISQQLSPSCLAELIPGSPVPAPGPPAPASHAACWWTHWQGTGSGARARPRVQVRAGGDTSALPRQVLRADWLDGGCHFAASRCITSTAVITVPWALTEDEHTTETTDSCSLLKSGGSKPQPSTPSCRGSRASQAQLRGNSFQYRASPSPGTTRSELWGFCLKAALQPSPQARCSSAVTRANPLPTASHRSLPRRGLWRELHPRQHEPHPLQQPGAPARPGRLSRVRGAGSSLLPRVTSDQWHL